MVVPPLLALFEQYHRDAMLAQDILDLIKTLGSVPDNTVFQSLIMP